MEYERFRRITAAVKFMILIVIIFVVPAVLYHYYKETLFNIEWLRSLPDLLRQYKGHAAAALIGLQILQVIICIIPGQPIQFASSYMFGILQGYIISIAGALIGAAVAFCLARLLGRDVMSMLFGEDRIGEYHRKINTGRGLMAVLIIYLIPGVPKDLVAYVAGISDMKLRPFLLVSCLGRTPGMLGSLLFGHFFGKSDYRAIGILAVITVIVIIIFIVRRKSVLSFLDRIESRAEVREQARK